MFKVILLFLCSSVFFVTPGSVSAQVHTPNAQTANAGIKCQPTKPDYLGPFYKAGAPIRSSVGKGYKLAGVVMSSANCSPIVNARVEIWLAGPDGSYDDDHRATIISNDVGEYVFESNFPPGYSGRPPHIHIRVSASGFKTLATQHYPQSGRVEGIFDLVLVPGTR